jgi:hypothetical protein
MWAYNLKPGRYINLIVKYKGRHGIDLFTGFAIQMVTLREDSY